MAFIISRSFGTHCKSRGTSDWSDKNPRPLDGRQYVPDSVIIKAKMALPKSPAKVRVSIDDVTQYGNNLLSWNPSKFARSLSRFIRDASSSDKDIGNSLPERISAPL